MGRVLHASYSGYFPFCLSEGDPSSVGTGTAFPLGMSLQNAMLLYWRIKSLNLTNPAGASKNVPLRKGFPQQNVASEEQIVCGGTSFNSFVDDPLNLFGASIILFQSNVIIKIGNIYYPNLQIF